MEERRHPEGFYSCTCVNAVQGGWKCRSCRRYIMTELERRAWDRAKQLRHTLRDGQSRIIYGDDQLKHNAPRSARHPNLRLPTSKVCRCGRKYQPNRTRQTVRHCLACDGVTVQKSVKAYMNIQQSADEQAWIAQEPTPDFTPVNASDFQIPGKKVTVWKFI